MKLVAALANLLLHLFLHLIRYPLRRARSGLARFMDNYQEEGLVPITPDQRQRLPEHQGCIGCGLCAAECAIVARERHSETTPDPSLIPVALSHVGPQSWAASRHLASFLVCEECRRCEEVCPRQVPLHEIAEFTRRNAQLRS